MLEPVAITRYMQTETPLVYQPFANVPELNELRKELLVNVSEHERFYSIISGVVSIAVGISRMSVTGMLLATAGAALVLRGTSGHCALYSALGLPSVAPATVPVDRS